MASANHWAPRISRYRLRYAGIGELLKQTTLHVDPPWETIRVGTGRDPRVREDSETDRAFLVVLYGLEEQALEPNSFRRRDLNGAIWLIVTFGYL